MRKLFLQPWLPVLGFVFCFSISAQQIPKPTLTPTEPTPVQKQLIAEGARLHDQKQYQEAIKKYEQVLQENPTCVGALYEKTLSLYYLKEYQRTLDTAFEGLKFKSTEVPLFYTLIANVYDDQGKPEKAVELYKQGIKILEGDREFTSYLASIYYNLGVTNVRQKALKEARENLKKAVQLNPRYASPHSLLSAVFFDANYRVPALLSASRLISLEINTPRSQRASQIIMEVLQGGVSAGTKPGDKRITIDPNAPTDEGDFGSLNLMLGISKVGTDMTDENKNQTEEDKFASHVESIIGFLETEEKIKASFVGKNYIPFMAELKRRGHTKPFAYIVLYHSGNEAARKWLIENNQKAMDFLSWAKTY